MLRSRAGCRVRRSQSCRFQFAFSVFSLERFMLPSQIGRPASSRAHMYSRRRSHKLLFGLVAIAVFAATYVVIKLWPGAGHGAAIDSASAASNDPIAPASAIADIELRSPPH